MLILAEAEFFVKRHIGQHVCFLCAERSRAVQRFINHRFRYALSPVGRHGADRLNIGVIGLAGIPQAAVGNIFSATVFSRYTERRYEMLTELRNLGKNIAIPFKFRLVGSVIKALP